jgi:hypothetical protein
MAPLILHEIGGFSNYGAKLSLPHIAFFLVNVSHSRNVLLREMGLAPSRITRVGRRPDGHGGPFLVNAGNAFMFVCMSLEGFSW